MKHIVKHIARIRYGLFLRQLRDSTFDGVTLSFEENGARSIDHDCFTSVLRLIGSILTPR